MFLSKWRNMIVVQKKNPQKSRASNPQTNPIGLGAYERNCYVSDVATVCVLPMKSGDHDK